MSSCEKSILHAFKVSSLAPHRAAILEVYSQHQTGFRMNSTEELIGRTRVPVQDTWSCIPGKNDAEGALGWGLTWTLFLIFLFFLTFDHYRADFHHRRPMRRDTDQLLFLHKKSYQTKLGAQWFLREGGQNMSHIKSILSVTINAQ